MLRRCDTGKCVSTSALLTLRVCIWYYRAKAAGGIQIKYAQAKSTSLQRRPAHPYAQAPVWGDYDQQLGGANTFAQFSSVQVSGQPVQHQRAGAVRPVQRSRLNCISQQHAGAASNTVPAAKLFWQDKISKLITTSTTYWDGGGNSASATYL
jgi:hypothetical protein